MAGSRIIIAAPSNSAANLIATKLVESNALKMGLFLRIVGHNVVERNQIPEELLPYCATVDIGIPDTSEAKEITLTSGLRIQSNLKNLQIYRIIISTCSSVGKLMQMGFPKNHFTHVIIDEAGQCTEPEAIIPICLLDRNNSQVIMAGDPMQLGPIVLSRFAKDRGLEQSFLVRILDRVPYSKDKEVIFSKLYLHYFESFC